MPDILNLEFLPDGTIKVTTDAVSAANHRNAEELLTLLDKLQGGEVKREKRKVGHTHTHSHGHDHDHVHV